MAELTCGIIWIAFSCLMVFLFYAGDGDVTINGEWVSQAEFNEMFWPKLFLGLFIAFGVFLVCKGLKKIITNITTSAKGEETYGIILDVRPNGSSVNDCPVLDAKIAIVEDNGMIGMYRETIGTSYDKYYTGEFVLLKRYKNDINILDIVDGIIIPRNHRERLEAEVRMSGIEQEQYEFPHNQYNDNMHWKPI